MHTHFFTLPTSKFYSMYNMGQLGMRNAIECKSVDSKKGIEGIDFAHTHTYTHILINAHRSLIQVTECVPNNSFTLPLINAALWLKKNNNNERRSMPQIFHRKWYFNSILWYFVAFNGAHFVHDVCVCVRILYTLSFTRPHLLWLNRSFCRKRLAFLFDKDINDNNKPIYEKRHVMTHSRT